MVFPDDKNIVPCQEGGNAGEAPQSLRYYEFERLYHRPIIEWSSQLGTYGMGGPGFFGLHLEATSDYPREWLILTLWNAEEWLLVDGKWLSAHPNQHHIQKPLYGWGDEKWDHFSDIIIGGCINKALIHRDQSLFEIEKDEEVHYLEIPRDTKLLPKYGGSLEQKQWLASESQVDAWVISETGELYC